jgi:hypothetical protein
VNFWLSLIFGIITTAGLALGIFNAVKNLDIQRLVEILEDLDENIEDIEERCCASGSVKRALREERASSALQEYGGSGLSDCRIVEQCDTTAGAFFIYSQHVSEEISLVCGEVHADPLIKIVLRPRRPAKAA